jgi:ABC-2 type transport system permease protein
MRGIQNICTIFKRELRSYFESPVAYVFLVVFLALTGFLTFSVANFYERNMADLDAFFFWHPWVYLLLVPAACMGLWAEERRAKTIELLLTMPVTMAQAILGKFFAAWAFIVVALALTFPIVLTTSYLGDPDMGVILCGYIGSALLAGAYVATGMLTSSLTRSQVIGFVLGLSLCLLMLLAGWEPVTRFFVTWAPAWVVDAVASLSFMPHFQGMQRGVVDLRDVAYYAGIIVFMLFANYVVLDGRRAA